MKKYFKHHLCNPHHKVTMLLFFLLLNNPFIKAQDSIKTDKKFHYRFTLGLGIGSGYPLQEDDFSIGSTIEFSLQRQSKIYGLGLRNIREFEILSTSNVPNSVNSVDITYGRTYKKKFVSASISAGLGIIYRCTKGKLLSRTSEGWLSSYSKYEKIINYSVGLPVSAKLCWVPTGYYGLGIELYANFNIKKTFYGINLCHQFGKLKSKNKNKRNEK